MNSIGAKIAKLTLLLVSTLTFSQCSLIFGEPDETLLELLALVGGGNGVLVAGQSVDLDGNGTTDGTVLDRDGNGEPDSLDLDGDGEPDVWLIDLDGDGISEFLIGALEDDVFRTFEGRLEVVSWNRLITPSARVASNGQGGSLSIDAHFPASEAGASYQLMLSTSGTGPVFVQGLAVLSPSCSMEEKLKLAQAAAAEAQLHGGVLHE